MNQPPLDRRELAILRQSIADHGVLCPVVRDKHGRLIDGHNRQRIAAELGIDCPEITAPVEGEAAERLALELQVGRRNLDREARDEYISALRRAGMTQEAIGEAVGVSRPTVAAVLNVKSDIETEQSAANTAIPRTISNTRGQRRPTKYNKRKPSTAIATVKKNNTETQLASMRNAPADKLNLPALRLAREIERQLRELATLDADKFLSQISANACRDFDPALAEYWSRWVALCKARAEAEAIPERRRVQTNGNLAAMPTSTIEERVISVLREKPAGLTAAQLANELLLSTAHISRACLRLVEMGLLARDQRQKPHVYRATLSPMPPQGTGPELPASNMELS